MYIHAENVLILNTISQVNQHELQIGKIPILQWNSPFVKGKIARVKPELISDPDILDYLLYCTVV